MPLKLLLLSLILIFSCDNPTENSCTETVDCSGVCGGSSVEDACGVCGGNTNSADGCSDASCEFDVCISIINVNYENNSLDIWMNNSISVAGFQFDINGITIKTASGGVAGENGLSVYPSNNVILSFSMLGALIPAGNNALTHIEFTENSDTICLANPVFSNQSGEPLSVSLGDFECD
jgi:hypothetical protein